jgi:hypothetical protein
MTAKLTDKQRQALQHLQRARREGVSLSAYARSHRLVVRRIYDAQVALRRKGVLAPAPPRVSRTQSPFVAVRVTPNLSRATPLLAALPRSGVVCRVLLGAAAVIECAEWPPGAWLTVLQRVPADAAS